MSNPIQVVRGFLSECAKSKEAMQQAFRKYFTAETVWENVGVGVTTGPEEAVGLMQKFEEASGVATFRAEILAIAADGNRVLTERREVMLDSDGKTVNSMAIMGIFEIEGDHIVAWRDYFDSASLGGQAGS